MLRKCLIAAVVVLSAVAAFNFSSIDAALRNLSSGPQVVQLPIAPECPDCYARYFVESVNRNQWECRCHHCGAKVPESYCNWIEVHDLRSPR